MLLNVKVIDPVRVATVLARQPIARSVPDDSPELQVCEAPTMLRKLPAVATEALFAAVVVEKVPTVPLPVELEEVQTPHPVGNPVPSESKFCE